MPVDTFRCSAERARRAGQAQEVHRRGTRKVLEVVLFELSLEERVAINNNDNYNLMMTRVHVCQGGTCLPYSVNPDLFII